MARKNETPASPVVRAWAVEQGLIPADGTKGNRRGRLGTSVIDAWNAAPEHKGQQYPTVYRPKVGPTVTHSVSVDRSGKKRTVKRTLPLAEVRERGQALGVLAARGKPSKAGLDAVFAAVDAEKQAEKSAN